MDIMKRLKAAVEKHGSGIIGAKLVAAKIKIHTANRLTSGNYPSIPKPELAAKIEEALK